MKYMGSKSRIAKYIVPILQKCIDDHGITKYIEPFVGGANVIDKIRCKHRIGCDINPYLIGLLKHVANEKEDCLLDEVTREFYSEIRANYKNGCYPDWLVGNVGFLASYNGRFFDGGYAQAGWEHTKSGDKWRDYYQEAKRNLLKQAEDLQGIEFNCMDYREMNPTVNDGSLIYCDPPYNNTKQFANSKTFDYDEFWNWVRILSAGDYVVVSELEAPKDFVCIWEHETLRSIKSTDKSTANEKLFVHKNSVRYFQ